MHVSVKTFYRRCLIAVLFLTVAALDARALDLRLIEAAKAQEWERVGVLLTPRQGLDVNAADPSGATALHWAAHWDHTETVKLLLRAGARTNMVNDQGVTPLMLACANGSDAVARLLLDAGAKVDALPPTGETPLMMAAMVGKAEIIKTLLSRGADVNAAEPSAGQTALMWASAQGHNEIVRALIAAGARLDARSRDDSYTALLFAARNGHRAAVETLLGAGANVNDAASTGPNALLIAAVRGHHALATFLLNHGADPNAEAAGYTPLHWLSQAMETELTGQYGIESEFTEWSALSALRAPNKIELVKALLAKGANPNARLTKRLPVIGATDTITAFPGYIPLIGGTPFMLAAQAGDLPLMQLLLANGADPTLAANDRTNALMMAAGFGRVEYSTVSERTAIDAAKMVLENGLDVNAGTANGETALHAAAYRQRNSLIQFLVDKGASVDVRNSRGMTPLAVAESRITYSGDKSTADLLRKLGASQ